MSPELYLVDDYFEWMCSHVCNEKQRLQYSELLRFLFNREFTYILPLDENRALDGVELRYRYGREADISRSRVELVLDIRPCTVLEMLVALSIRIEETIMDNPEEGDRTPEWFWMMLYNLELTPYEDSNFSEEQVEFIVNRFLERIYDTDGKGGLVYIRNPRSNLRDVEIWYQLMWYISDNYL